MTPLLLALLALSSPSPARAQGAGGYVFAECGNDEATRKIPQCSCGKAVFGTKAFKLALYVQGKVPLDEMSLFVNPYLRNADAALKKFNMKLNTDTQFMIGDRDHWDTPVRGMEQLCATADEAFKAHPPPSDALPVFFLYLDGDVVLGADAVAQNFNAETARIECGNSHDVSRWPSNFIVVNDRAERTTTQVLIHEIGHALGRISGQTDKFQHREGKSTNLMLTGGSVDGAENVSMTTEQLPVFCNSGFTATQY